MKDIPIEKFGTKLMVSSKSINKIPPEYMKEAFNVRIYDGGIGPRRGKVLLTDSTLGTNNKGAFILNNKLFQIANSKIYEIDMDDGTQTEKATLGYDQITDILVYEPDIAIIVADGQALKVYDGTTNITIPGTVPPSNTGIIEFARGYSFLADGKTLYVSRPILASNPEYAYDFTDNQSQNISFTRNILGLKGTLNGIYIFNGNIVEFIGANGLQNIAGSSTFISTPLGRSGEPINNLCIASSEDRLFYITKNLQIQTVNFISGSTGTQIGELSARPIIGIKELLQDIDKDQPTAFAFENQNDKTIEFHVRSINSQFNDRTIVYDLVNDTWAVDTGKKYNYVVPYGKEYFGFSDVNSSIYRDGQGFSDAGTPISSKLLTQKMNYGSIRQKRCGGLFTAGGIGDFTQLNYRLLADEQSVFIDNIVSNKEKPKGIGEIGGQGIGEAPIGGWLTYESELEPFERMGDEGRIYRDCTKIQIEITSTSNIQDYIIDILGTRIEQTNNIDTSNKW